MVAVGNGHLRLITHNPRKKRQKAEEVIPIDLDEYAEVVANEDNRDIYIDRIIRNFLFPVRPLQLLEND